jgi:hypothetical protein
MISTYINDFGLLLDILGAFLVWRYVANINFADEEEFLRGNATITLADPTKKEINEHKNRKNMGRLGIVILIVGFILQILSNHI